MGSRVARCSASCFWRWGWIRSLFFLWLLASPCRAGDLQTEWNAPPGCPGVQAFEAKLAELIPEQDLPLHLRIEMRIFRTGGTYIAELTLRGDVEGKRALESETCEELARAAAVVVALSIRASGPDPEESDDRGDEPKEQSDPKDDATATSGIHFGISAGGRVDFLLLPAVSAGPELGFLVLNRMFRFAVYGGYLFPVARTYALRDGATAGTATLSMSAFDIRVEGCGVSPTILWSVGLCLGAGLDVLRYVGSGSDSDDQGTTLSGRAHASVLGAVRLSERLELTLRGGPWLNFKRQPFSVLIGESVVPAFVPKAVGAELALGATAHF